MNNVTKGTSRQSGLLSAIYMSDWLSFNPRLPLSWKRMTIDQLTVVLVPLIAGGVHTVDGISLYIAERGCPHNHDVVEYVVDRYAGESPKALWHYDKYGILRLNQDIATYDAILMEMMMA